MDEEERGWVERVGKDGGRQGRPAWGEGEHTEGEGVGKQLLARAGGLLAGRQGRGKGGWQVHLSRLSRREGKKWGRKGEWVRRGWGVGGGRKWGRAGKGG